MIAVNEFTIVKIYDGEQGVSVVAVVPEYTVHTSSSSLPPSPTWSETKPTNIDSTHYLWTRYRTDLSDGSHEYSDATCDIVISGIISEVNNNTQSITNKVWESDITSKINQYDGSTISTIRGRVTQTETDITGITSRVSAVETETDGFNTRMSSAESSITQNAGKISAMVTVDGQTSAITLTNNMIEAMTSQFVVKSSDNSTTVISGGKITSNSIKTNDLATDAIKSSNYIAGGNGSHYSVTGSFLDLSNGYFYTPYLGVDNSGAYVNGTINAISGVIAGLNVNTVSSIEDQYPLNISATNVDDITIDNTTHIVTVEDNDTIVTYTFDAKYQISNNEYEDANFIYYSPIYSFSEDESGEPSDDEVDISTTIYYLLQPADADPPTKPTTDPPPVIQTTGYTGWTDTKPSYTPSSSLLLYAVEQTKYISDGSFEYTDPYLVDDDDGTNSNNQSQSNLIQNQVNINNVIDVTITYLNINSNTQPITQTTIGTEVYTSSYRDSGWWNYQLNRTLLDSSTTVKVQFTLVAGATISLRVGYGRNSALTYNTSKLLSVDNSNHPSIYVGTNGISVSDKIGLFPNGIIQTDYIEIRGKGMEFINTNEERIILIKNTAYNEGKTYATDHIYPHSCALYGGNSTSRMAFGLFDRRQNNAVWRYDDYNNILRIEKRAVFYASLVPYATNSCYLGFDDARFYAAYIGTIQIGEENYKKRTGGIFSKWRDNKVHYLLSRSTDGLTTILGWSGSSTGTSTVYHSSTQIKGYEVSLNSNGGGIKLNGGVTAGGTIIPKTNNSQTLGSSTQIWADAYINDIHLGSTSYSDAAVIACYWKDGQSHNLLWRDGDGLTTYLGLSGTSSYKTKVQINGYDGVTIAHDLIVNDTLTVKKVKNVTGIQWATNQNPNRYQCVISGGICHFWYMGAATTHSNGASLGTLPSGARPTSQVVIPFVKMNGGAVGVISITTGGAISVSQITSATDNTRIYFNCSFPVVSSV